MKMAFASFLAGAIVALAAVLAAQRLRPSQIWLLVMFGAGAAVGMIAGAMCAGGGHEQ